MSQSPNLATDMLIYAALETVDTHSWVIDTLSNHGVCDDHETETDALADAVGDLHRATYEFTHYSDGRVIRANEVIDNGIHVSHVFPAVVEHRGERLLFTDRRLRDPGTPDRGHYRVYVDDAAATMRVEVFGPLESV
ncbi:hypothetical protein [Gordonia sputi]